MAVRAGTPHMLPTIEEGVSYPGDWRLIPCAIDIPVHGELKRQIDKQGFYRLTDGSEEGIVAIDAFEAKSAFVPFNQIGSADLHFWVEDAEKHRVVRASLARLYLKGITPVVRIHPHQFHELMMEKKIPAKHVHCSVTCLATCKVYSFAYQGELTIPAEGVDLQLAKVLQL